MITQMSILDQSGDTKVTWDHDNPDECEKARAKVADLKAKGYTFFLVDGQPADEVSAGEGYLSARIIAADEVVAISEPQPQNPVPPVAKRRGRPAGVPNQSVIAVRPVAGG